MIERAAVIAAGTSSTAILTWIVDHGGHAAALAPFGQGDGLHGLRRTDTRSPLRYVIPAVALGDN